MKAWLVFLLMLPALAGAWSEADEERYQALLGELRCLVCQNQSIADSSATLAGDLRAQVRQQMEAGRSDGEIRAYMTARYGDFVLYRPPLKASTWALWLGPFVMLLLGAIVIWRLRRQRPAAGAGAAVDQETVARILSDAEDRP